MNDDSFPKYTRPRDRDVFQALNMMTGGVQLYAPKNDEIPSYTWWSEALDCDGGFTDNKTGEDLSPIELVMAELHCSAEEAWKFLEEEGCVRRIS